jgi:glycosyltransferase involved in cell wall biosynthesis
VIHLITREPLAYQQTLCQALSDSYGQAFVAWFDERGNQSFPPRADGASGFAYHFLSEVGYRRLLKELRADPEAVVILGGWSSPMTRKTLLITRLLRIPLFIWADHPHPRKRAWPRDRFRRLYLHALARMVEGFLACGSPTVEHLVSLGLDRDRITNFPYWVELPENWSLPNRCLDKEVEGRPLRLLAIGRHVPVKQFDVAIEAVALANRKAGRQLAELIMIGDGPERASLEALAQSLGCEATVSFPGWIEISDVYQELREADALVLTSKFDAFGVVVLEAMAAGRPVLASAGVIAARDRDEGSGAILLHPIGNADHLAEQIILLATNSDQLRRASGAARLTAEKWPLDRAATIVGEILEKTKRGRRLLQRRQQQTAAALPSPRVARGSVKQQRAERTVAASGGK